MLPKHGKVDCRICFKDIESDLVSPHPEWRMINDPGAWGGSEPKYLVLGFSKGKTQAGIYKSGLFKDVAFANMRPRLTQALRAMNVLSPEESVDEKIADPNSNIGFGSLIRCSVSRKDKKATLAKGEDVYACTGSLISKSFAEIPQVINACTNRFLNGLPTSVRVVFMLGNSDSYVSKCQSLVRKLFPASFRPVNSMAVHADGRLWVHLAHPSGLNGHFDTWLAGDSGPGLKRINARKALDQQ